MLFICKQTFSEELLSHAEAHKPFRETSVGYKLNKAEAYEMGRETEMQPRILERKTIQRNIPNLYDRLYGRTDGNKKKGTGSPPTPMLQAFRKPMHGLSPVQEKQKRGMRRRLPIHQTI